MGRKKEKEPIPMKAGRNKTIDLPLEEGQVYLSQCLTVTAPVTLSQAQNRLILGDNLTVMPFLPEKSVDLLIADPPYNMNKAFHTESFKKQSAQEYARYTRMWIEKALPLLKDNATVYVCCDWYSGMVIGSVLQEYFYVNNRVTWQREKGRGSQKGFKNGMEDIWCASVGREPVFHPERVMLRKRVIAPYRENGAPKDWEETPDGRFRNTYPSNFWSDITVPYWSMAENTAHPTQKPEKLLAKLILASSEENDVVFDPFAGSGSALVTAKKLGRRFIGVEKDAQYCVWAQLRLNRADNDKTIQGFSDGVFWERNAKVTK